MMKRFLLLSAVLLLVVLPCSLFAEDAVSIGAAYTFLEVELPLAGIEARYDHGLLQASSQVLYAIPYDTVLASLDVGPYVEIGPVGLGISAGPSYIFSSGLLMANVKAALDLNVGPVTVNANLSGYRYISSDADDDDKAFIFFMPGIAVLYQL